MSACETARTQGQSRAAPCELHIYHRRRLTLHTLRDTIYIYIYIEQDGVVLRLPPPLVNSIMTRAAHTPIIERLHDEGCTLTESRTPIYAVYMYCTLIYLVRPVGMSLKQSNSMYQGCIYRLMRVTHFHTPVNVMGRDEGPTRATRPCSCIFHNPLVD